MGDFEIVHEADGVVFRRTSGVSSMRLVRRGAAFVLTFGTPLAYAFLDPVIAVMSASLPTMVLAATGFTETAKAAARGVVNAPDRQLSIRTGGRGYRESARHTIEVDGVVHADEEIVATLILARDLPKEGKTYAPFVVTTERILYFSGTEDQEDAGTYVHEVLKALGAKADAVYELPDPANDMIVAAATIGSVLILCVEALAALALPLIAFAVTQHSDSADRALAGAVVGVALLGFDRLLGGGVRRTVASYPRDYAAAIRRLVTDRNALIVREAAAGTSRDST